MGEYTYTGGVDGDHFYEGLPAQDLNDADLTEAQKQQLMIALTAGHYTIKGQGPGVEIVRETKIESGDTQPIEVAGANDDGSRPESTTGQTDDAEEITQP